MKVFSIFGKEIFAYGPKAVTKKSSQPIDVKVLPPGRVSQPSDTNNFPMGAAELNVLTPKFLMEFIPLIRNLAYSNQNISQALNNIVELGNTGHTIKFDASVSEENINKMRAHIKAVEKEWSESLGGMNGLVNKMISQVMIGGALSVEWVPNMALTGIRCVVLVNPELIRWNYNNTTLTYEPYQYVEGIFNQKILANGNLLKLNPYTYKYYSLNGDTDNPYGIPPYLPAIGPAKTQKLMMDNIEFIVEQIGVLGFLQVLVDKPDMEGGESLKNYTTRLNKFLDDVRKRVQEGYRDGISVGYKDDTEFDFHSTTKDMGGVAEIFQLNELQFASGLKQDSSMLGRNYGTSESQITVIFTKLISQLKNVQNLIKCNLEYGYALELRLAGFKFNSINVEFNPSTALDELKAQQADEIKVRNLNALYLDGIISQEQYAHAMNLEKPNQKEPRMFRGQVQSQAEVDAKREAGKNKSDKKVRDKNKPQGAKKP